MRIKLLWFGKSRKYLYDASRLYLRIFQFSFQCLFFIFDFLFFHSYVGLDFFKEVIYIIQLLSIYIIDNAIS